MASNLTTVWLKSDDFLFCLLSMCKCSPWTSPSRQTPCRVRCRSHPIHRPFRPQTEPTCSCRPYRESTGRKTWSGFSQWHQTFWNARVTAFNLCESEKEYRVGNNVRQNLMLFRRISAITLLLQSQHEINSPYLFSKCIDLIGKNPSMHV